MTEAEGGRTPEPHDIGIGSRLRAARRRLDWSREALALHSGLSWSAIAQIESGRRRNLRPATLQALADALGVTIDYLVTGRGSIPAMVEHRALLYETDEQFVMTASAFLTEALERSEAALAVTTTGNIHALQDQLGPLARDVKFVERSRWYRTPTSALRGYRTYLDAKLEAGAPWVRILGEPVWEGRSESEVRCWTRYESLLNLVFSAAPVTVMCPYDTRAVDPEIVSHARVTHPHTVEGQTLKSSPAYADPSRFVLEP